MLTKLVWLACTAENGRTRFFLQYAMVKNISYVDYVQCTSSFM